MVLAQVLAAADPDAAATGQSVLIFVAVGCPIISLVLGALGLWLSSRRQPPIAEEMYKQFIPRSEASETVQRLDDRVDDAFAEISAIRSNMTKAYGDFERALGRIEGKLDDSRKHHGHHS